MRGVKTRLLGLAAIYAGVLVTAVAANGFDAKPATGHEGDPTWIFHAVLWPFLAAFVALGVGMVAGGVWALATGRAPWPLKDDRDS